MFEALATTTLLIGTRVAMLVWITPGLAQRVVPWRVRVALTLLLSLVVLSTYSSTPHFVASSVEFSQIATHVAHEAAVGCSLAMVPAVMIFGLQFAARGLRGLAGLGEVTAESGQEFSSAPLDGLLHMTVVVIFFLSGGHRQVVQGLLESFRWLPPGQHVALDSIRHLLLDLLAQSFALGIRTMSPLLAAMMMSFLALAILNRTVPQLSHFVVGMNVQALVILGVVLVFVGGILGSTEQTLNMAIGRVELAWQQVLAPVTSQDVLP